MTERFKCSGCKIAKVKFEWNVEIPFLQTTNGNGRPINSSSFSSKEIPDSLWKLTLFDQETKCVIMAFHYNFTSVNIVDAKLLKMSIKLNSSEDHRQIMPSYAGRFEIPKTECPHSNGRLTLCCEILTLVRKEVVPPCNPPGVAVDCCDGLVTQLEGLFDSMQFSDVIFNIRGRKFPAHKSLLAARIKPFSAMFEHSTKEKLTNQIEIVDIEPEVFDQLLRFIYTGRLSTTTMETMCVDLFIVADKYLIDQLKIECENYLLRKLSPVSCVELLLNSNLLSSTEKLKKEVVKFFSRFPSQVMATDKWKDLIQENPALLSDILNFISCSE